MIPITYLSMVRPDEVQPGTLLIGCGHYDRPPMFIFRFGDSRWRFDFGPGGEHAGGFVASAMAVNLHHYLRAGEPTVLVDVESRISPTRSDMPQGAVALVGEVPAYIIRLGHGTAYVGLDGTPVEDPRTYDNLVAFGNWKLTVPGEAAEPQVVYEARLEAE